MTIHEKSGYAVQGRPGSISRKAFLGMTGMSAAALMLGGGPLQSLGARAALGQEMPSVTGYGPLVPKGDLFLPKAFNYQIISVQGQPQRSNGAPGSEITPGIFDAMGAFSDAGGGVNPPGDTTILIRNHENRRRAGEIPVMVPQELRYDEDPSYNGGCTKLVVKRDKAGKNADGQQLYTYEVLDSFNILGGTDSNCAGGELPFKKWITCEEVVNRSPITGKKHGYNYEIDATSDGPVKAVPILAAGRFVHEATAWRAGVLYQTEDRRVGSAGGSCFYRYTPDQRIGQSGNLAETTGPLEALAVKGQPRFNADAFTVVGEPLPVEWVPVPEADHDDDTDNRRDRVPNFTPTRFQAQDNGAAIFDREEGIWVSGVGQGAKVYFDCTEGGPQNLGQVWEYDPGRETLTLIYISTDRNTLENPDNITIVPQTQDIFLCEDSPGEQFIRGVTQDGEIYNFAQTLTNDSEFAGACFDPDGQTLYVNQQGGRGNLPGGIPEARAVTYAIYGPFEKREGNNSKNFGNGPSA